jgi:hypothetical protein
MKKLFVLLLMFCGPAQLQAYAQAGASAPTPASAPVPVSAVRVERWCSADIALSGPSVIRSWKSIFPPRSGMAAG